MKILVLSLLSISILVACKKEPKQATPDPIFPEGRGMIGKVGKDSFSASSMDTHVHYHTTTGEYSMDIGTMDKKTGQIIVMSFKNFIYERRQYDLTQRLFASAVFWKNNYAYTSVLHSNDEKDENCKSGYLKIYSIISNVMKGSYNFITVNNTLVEGTFRSWLGGKSPR